MKPMLLLVLIISLSGCIMPQDFNRQGAGAVRPQIDRQNDPLWQEMESIIERDRQLKKEMNLLTQEADAFSKDRKKYWEKEANFLNTLSDKELRAYSAMMRGLQTNNDAKAFRAYCKFYDLLTASGKADAYDKLMQEFQELDARCQADIEKFNDLDARIQKFFQDKEAFEKKLKEIKKEAEQNLFRAQLLWEMHQQTWNQQMMLWEMQDQNRWGHK